MRLLLQTTAGRIALALVACLTVGVVVGLLALWPHGDHELRAPLGIGNVQHAEIVRVTSGTCEAWAGPGCRLAEIELRSGPATGKRSFFTFPTERFAPRIAVGDQVRVARNLTSGIDPNLSEQLPIDDPAQQPFSFVDFDRETPLLALGIAFAVLVLLLGRSHGARALVGLGASLVVIVEFVVPALLDGERALFVALVGSLAVMIVTIAISHGAGVKALSAILGTATALGLTAGLAVYALDATNISGFSSEEATFLLSGVEGNFSLQGLVLAGMVIGALGVLDDVTVSQASTVLALRRANPALGVRRLFAEALAVGRDHLGATVNTLVLAYAGAALPVLLIFNQQATPFGEAINREPVAEQVVAMLVGSIGLIAAVPLTTAVAALLAVRMPAEALPEHDHAH